MMPKSLSGSLRVCSFSVIEDWVSAWAVVDVSADRGYALSGIVPRVNISPNDMAI